MFRVKGGIMCVKPSEDGIENVYVKMCIGEIYVEE